MKDILITGGTGFIGRELVTKLKELNCNVYILTRNQSKAQKHPNFIHWEPSKQFVSEELKKKNYTIINLAGENIAAKRWSPTHKEKVLKSREDILNTLRTLIETHRIECDQLISASAVGYYGNADGLQQEINPGDNSYLSTTCKAWEAAAHQFEQLNIAVSIVRIGIVLGKTDGALPKLTATLPFKFMGLPGSGTQIFPWIHIQDVVGIFIHLYQNKTKGIFNAVAPQRTSMKELFGAIKKIKNYWLCLPVPAFILKVIMGELSIEVLKSTEVSADKIQTQGYSFAYNTIDKALKDIL